MEAFETINPFENYLYEKASLNTIPISGTFELLPTCNMNCKMCYVRMEQKDVDRLGGLRPMQYWLKLADQAVEEGMLFLLLTGGEPFLYPDFLKLYEELHKKGIYLTLNTNGTLITEDIARFFGEHPPRRINLTIYGKDNETYAKLCNNPKGFSQLEAAVGYLKKYNVQMKINCSLTPYNIGQVDEMRGFAERMGLPIEIGYYMMPPNRKLEKGEYDKHRLTAKEAAKASFDIKMYGRSPEERKQKAQKELEKKNSLKLEDKPKCGFWCRAGNCVFWMNWKGEMVPCGMLNEPKAFVDLEDGGFKEAWKSISKTVREIQLAPKCYYCENRSICMHCAATENAETGKFGCSPTYLCELTENYLELIENEVQ